MRIAKLLNCYIVKLMVECDGEIRDYQKGQILLLSLLVLTVSLTIGLSVAVRTVTTTRMISAEDSSQRAFSAAEAGLEKVLTAGAGNITGSFATNNSSYSTSKSSLSGDEILAENGALIFRDDAADIWLSDYPDYTNPWPLVGSRNLTIYWGNISDVCNQSESNTMAAIEVILISGTRAVPLISHFAYDPCGGLIGTRRDENKFSPVSPGGTVKGKNFAYSAVIPVTSGLLARVIPLYADTYIGVRGTGLPSQGMIVTSIGNSGETQRKIVSFRGYPNPPIELYPFLILSPK